MTIVYNYRAEGALSILAPESIVENDDVRVRNVRGAVWSVLEGGVRYETIAPRKQKLLQAFTKDDLSDATGVLRFFHNEIVVCRCRRNDFWTNNGGTYRWTQTAATIQTTRLMLDSARSHAAHEGGRGRS